MSEREEILLGYVEALANRIELALPGMKVRIFRRDLEALRWALAGLDTLSKGKRP